MKFDIFESVCFNCSTWRPYSRESQIGWCPEGYVRGKTKPVFTDKNDCCGRWKTIEPEEVLEESESENENMVLTREQIEEAFEGYTGGIAIGYEAGIQPEPEPEPEIGAKWEDWEDFYNKLLTGAVE